MMNIENKLCKARSIGLLFQLISWFMRGHFNICADQMRANHKANRTHPSRLIYFYLRVIKIIYHIKSIIRLIQNENIFVLDFQFVLFMSFWFLGKGWQKRIDSISHSSYLCLKFLIDNYNTRQLSLEFWMKNMTNCLNLKKINIKVRWLKMYFFLLSPDFQKKCIICHNNGFTVEQNYKIFHDICGNMNQ